MQYILFDSLGIIKNIYATLVIAQFYAGDYDNMYYCPITDEVYNYYKENNKISSNFIVDVARLRAEKKEVLDNIEYLLIKEDLDFEKMKNNLIWHIGKVCENYIYAGKKIKLKDGTEEIFTFSPLDQIDLHQLITFHTKGQKVYYHNYNNLYKFYDYEDILIVYQELYNNKLYNIIYSQVFTDWINNNLTKELLFDPKNFFDYGYANDEIIKKVEEIFANERISK